MDDARVAATIEAWWAAPAPLTTVRGPGGDVLEPPSVEVREWNHPIDVKPGVWTLLPSSGGISLAVRATVHTPEPAPRGPKGLATVPGRRESGPRTLHRWTISDLDAPVASSQGSDALRLTPPSFTPPPPPEPAEPVRLFPSESLVDVLKLFLGPPSFDPERAGFVRGRTLWASVDSDTAGAIQPLLAALRARFLARTRVRSMVISLPLTSLPEYFSGLDDGVELLADGGAALTRRPGARVLDRQALVLLSGQRDAVVAGREHSYVADYDIIGEKGLIGKPIVRSWLEGSSLDLQADRSLAANAVSCEMRLDLSSLRDNRQVPTPHGAIECPSIGIQRMSGGFTVPVGGSRIVAAHLENGVVTLVILSAESE